MTATEAYRAVLAAYREQNRTHNFAPSKTMAMALAELERVCAAADNALTVRDEQMRAVREAQAVTAAMRGESPAPVIQLHPRSEE